MDCIELPMIFEWIEVQRWWLQWVPIFLLTVGTLMQGILTVADQRQVRLDSKRTQESLTKISSQLEQMSHVEGIDRYLQPIKIESLRKYVRDQELKRLEDLLLQFSRGFQSKDSTLIKSSVDAILKIIPADPFFRVYRLILRGHLIQDLFSGKYRVVQVVRWDWLVEGDEHAALYVTTQDETGQGVTFGPFANNLLSMLDSPLKRYVQIRVESHGKGRFQWYPGSFKIGWAVAEKQGDGNWVPLMGMAEYDPTFTLGLNGDLEW